MTDSFDYLTELRGDSAHVYAWKVWYLREGRHFDNSLRHPDHQLPAHMHRGLYDTGHTCPAQRCVARRVSPWTRALDLALVVGALGCVAWIVYFVFTALFCFKPGICG